MGSSCSRLPIAGLKRLGKTSSDDTTLTTPTQGDETLLPQSEPSLDIGYPPVVQSDPAGIGILGLVGTTRPCEESPGSSATFHLFPDLPAELRRHIWLCSLDDESPRAYEFWYNASWDNPESEPILIPGHRYQKYDTTDLVWATATIRAVGMSCREAREAVVHLFPDLMPFRLTCVDGITACPLTALRHLRFNARRDIIVLSMVPRTELYRTLRWSARTGRLPSWHHIQHVAFDCFHLPNYMWRCHCGRPGCDLCRTDDPLPEFLAACFPALASFHIAEIDSSWEDPATEDQPDARRMEAVPRCACPPTAGKRHEWPLIRSGSQEWDGHYVSYREDGSCPFSPLEPLARERARPTGLGWPKQDGMDHLDIRILRMLRRETDSEGKPDTRVCSGHW